jgi:hypothetical protein
MRVARSWNGSHLAAAQRTAEAITELLGALELDPTLRLALEAAIQDAALALPLSRAIRTHLGELAGTAVAADDARGIQDAWSRFRVTELTENTERLILNLEEARRDGTFPERDAARYLKILYELHEIWSDLDRHRSRRVRFATDPLLKVML